jgi:hypothetical protein
MKLLLLLQNLKTMNKYLIFIFLLIFPQVVFAQTETRVAQNIRGKVINLATNEAIPYANIGIEGTFYGTASDSEGNFELKIPEEMMNKQIFFSALSFKNDTFAVRSFFDKEFSVVKLSPMSYNIAEVDVEAQSRVLIRILRMAAENVPYNFLGGPFNLEATFLNQKSTADTVTVFQSDALIFDRSGYRNPSKTDAFKMRNYKFQKYEPAYSFASGITNFDELLELDWVRSATSVMNPALLSKFNLSLEDEPQIDGTPAWVISFSQNEPTLPGSQDFYATSFEGKITISKDDYSVKRIEGKAESPKQSRQGKNLAVGNLVNHYFEDVSYTFEISYSKLKPEKFIIRKNYKYQGERVEETSQLIVNHVQTDKVKEIASRDYFAE